MSTFELRKYVEGKWVLDTIFDEKSEAIAEARALMARVRALSAVRIVAVTEDETGFKERTVYKQTIVDEDNEQATQRVIQNRREVEAARAMRDSDGPRAEAQAAHHSAAWLYYAGLMIRVVAIITAGAFALVCIHRQFM
jgi:secreted Zn-dependent insulinase-like peptidase